LGGAEAYEGTTWTDRAAGGAGGLRHRLAPLGDDGDRLDRNGYSRGYARGYADGGGSGDTPGRGYSDGYSDGYSAGYSDGYSDGHFAPDGTRSTSIQLTVPDGGVTGLLGVNPPDVSMVYPPSLDTSFTGTVWLVGSGFVRGCWATVLSPRLPPYVVPLDFLNERSGDADGARRRR
jgi:hypothetical protein